MIEKELSVEMIHLVAESPGEQILAFQHNLFTFKIHTTKNDATLASCTGSAPS